MAELRRQDLAAGLGISRQMAYRLAQQGMPTDSIEVAQRWRDAHVRQKMKMGNRMARAVRPKGEVEIAAVEQLWPVALAALKANRFDLVEVAMREALRAVPKQARSRVLLDFTVFDRLTEHTAAALRVDEPPADQPADWAVMPGAGDAYGEKMGRFWYSVAAAEPIDWTEFE